MSALMLALLLQSGSITGGLDIPQGMTPPATARVVLLPLEYARMFNAEAQQRLDNYWENYKPAFVSEKELFIQVMPRAYSGALESVVSRMRRDSKINIASLIKTAPLGQFEFHGVPSGEYRLVATASIRDVDYVWVETVQVESGSLFMKLKNRVP